MYRVKGDPSKLMFTRFLDASEEWNLSCVGGQGVH